MRERIEKLYQLTRARFEAHATWFRTFAPQGRVMEISGPHFIFMTNGGEVVQQIDTFAKSLPTR